MIWYVGIAAVLVIGALVVLAAGRDRGMQPTADDRTDVLLPTDRRLGADDIAHVRFTTAFRGYRMDEVDELLARLRAEMSEHDRRHDPHDPHDPTAPELPQEDDRAR